MILAAIVSFMYTFVHSNILLVMLINLYAAAVLNVTFYCVAKLVRATRLVNDDGVYYTILMWDELSVLGSSVLAVVSAHYLSENDLLRKLSKLWLILAALRTLQFCLLNYLTSVTIWKAYLPRIRDTVLAHEVITGLSSYAEKYAPTADDMQHRQVNKFMRRKSTLFFDSESLDNESQSPPPSSRILKSDPVPLHSAHAAVQTNWATRIPSVSDLYDRILFTLQYGRTPLETVYKTGMLRMLNISPGPIAVPNAHTETFSDRCFTEQHLRQVFFADSNLADEALALLDRNGDGRVDKEEFMAVFQGISERCDDLQRTIEDYESMTDVLNQALTCCSLFCIIFVILVVFDVNVRANTSFVLSLFVSFSIVFGSTLQNFFEGMVFVFAVRPYDVGDRVFIRDESGREQDYLVRRITLMVTEFRRADGISVTTSNRKLRDLFIVNAYRAQTASHEIRVPLTEDVNVETLEELLHTIRSLSIESVLTADLSYEPSSSGDASISTACFTVVQDKSFQDAAVKQRISNALRTAVHNFFQSKRASQSGFKQ